MHLRAVLVSACGGAYCDTYDAFNFQTFLRLVVILATLWLLLRLYFIAYCGLIKILAAALACIAIDFSLDLLG